MNGHIVTVKSSKINAKIGTCIIAYTPPINKLYRELNDTPALSYAQLDYNMFRHACTSLNAEKTIMTIMTVIHIPTMDCCDSQPN